LSPWNAIGEKCYPFGLVRVLVTSCGGYGHFYPLVPILRALEHVGHTVEVAVPADFVEVVRRAGFQASGIREVVLTPAGHAERRREAEATDPRFRAAAHVRDFATDAERALDELRVIADRFCPDVIVRDLMAFGGWILGGIRRCPVVVFDFFPIPPDLWALAGGEVFTRLRERAGLTEDPALSTLAGALTLVGGPRSWVRYASPETRFYRPNDEIPEGTKAPDWLDQLNTPFVYATLGTTFNDEPGLWNLVLDGLEKTGIPVVATVGNTVDPGSLGSRPARIRVETFVPQRFLLDRCAAALTHGGYGSLIGALSRGVPVVSVPIAAGDNVPNAKRLTKLGAGIAVFPEERSAQRIADATRSVLDEPTYRIRARAVADEIASLPPVEEAVGWIEAVALGTRA
jgi:UDP:flavonoid glycosyltransferase YjiC (YdhE family)